MKFLELLSAIPKLFDWYFNMDSLKRIQLNYITLIALILTYIYYTQQNYAENMAILSNRVDTTNNARAKEQEKYTAKLEFYTDKFNNLLVMVIDQRKEIKQIKEEK